MSAPQHSACAGAANSSQSADAASRTNMCWKFVDIRGRYLRGFPMIRQGAIPEPCDAFAMLSRCFRPKIRPLLGCHFRPPRMPRLTPLGCHARMPPRCPWMPPRCPWMPPRCHWMLDLQLSSAAKKAPRSTFSSALGTFGEQAKGFWGTRKGFWGTRKGFWGTRRAGLWGTGDIMIYVVI